MEKQLQLTIEEFSREGHGRGKGTSQEGRSYEIDVPFSIPGDEVNVRLLKRKKGRNQSEVLEWLQLAPQRVTPRCQHFGKCGGCRW